MTTKNTLSLDDEFGGVDVVEGAEEIFGIELPDSDTESV
jgi:hypothetical protein